MPIERHKILNLYQAPETVLTNDKTATVYAGRKSDLWSCGVVLVKFHEFLTRISVQNARWKAVRKWPEPT